MTNNDQSDFWQWPNRHERLLELLSDATSRKSLYENWLHTSQGPNPNALVNEWQLTIGWALLGWPGIDRKVVRTRLGMLLAGQPLNPYLPNHLQKSPQLKLPLLLD